MKTLIRMLALVAALVPLTACSSQMPVGKDATAVAEDAEVLKPRAGDAATEKTDTAIVPATAGSYMGSATSTALTTAAKREIQSTAGGPQQFAFLLSGGTKEHLEFVQKQLSNDTALNIYTKQAEAILNALKNEDGTARSPSAEEAALLKELAEGASARVDAINANGRAMGGSVDSLSSLIVFNWITGWSTGDELEQMGEHEAAAASASATRLFEMIEAIVADSDTVEAQGDKAKAAVEGTEGQ